MANIRWLVGWPRPAPRIPRSALRVFCAVYHRHYTYRYCSPTRAAFLTGRSPYKLLNIRENLIPTQIPESTDTRFTMLPKRLHEADYISYQVGKVRFQCACSQPFARPSGSYCRHRKQVVACCVCVVAPGLRISLLDPRWPRL